VIKEVGQYTVAVEHLWCGNKLTEKFREDTVSIIRTLIKQMTELETLNVCFANSTSIFMEESEKTIKLLKVLNTESARSAENTSLLIAFKNGVLALIRDIAKTVAGKNLGNGETQIGINTMPTTENTVSRIKYCAKSSKRERGEFNDHATVKPLALMEYLCQLVKMPEYNLIIDPFMGSGTTLLACIKLGIPVIGIDDSESSCEIATKRCSRGVK